MCVSNFFPMPLSFVSSSFSYNAFFLNWESTKNMFKNESTFNVRDDTLVLCTLGYVLCVDMTCQLKHFTGFFYQQKMGIETGKNVHNFRRMKIVCCFDSTWNQLEENSLILISSDANFSIVLKESIDFHNFLPKRCHWIKEKIF